MKNQKLFNYMANNHDVILMESEMEEIKSICDEIRDSEKQTQRDICPYCNTNEKYIECKCCEKCDTE
jgi:hypothetical protein